MDKRKSLLLLVTIIVSLLAFAGTALAQDPSVMVTSPAPGTTVNAAAAINITGTAANLPAGATILVQTRVSDADADNSNDPVAGETTVVVDVGGNWHASVNLTLPLLSPGIPGNIIAYAQVSGSTVATSNIVNITYGSSSVPTATPTATFTATTVPPTATPTATSTTPVNTATPTTTATNPAQPRVTITSPVQNAIFPTGVAIAVTGTGANLFEGNVVVRALNANSDVLTQVPTVLDAAGNWIAYLTVNVPTGTRGSIYAFSTSPVNGAVVASSRVEVTYGGPCVVRADWFTYTVQSGDTLFRIAQRVGSSVNELALANCLSNTNLVYAGQVLRVPRLPVQQPTASPTSLRILSPQPNAVLDTSIRVPVNGTGRGIAGYSVVVRALDAQGRVLAQQVSTASAANAAGDSTWQVSLSVVAQANTPGSIYAYAVVPNTGATAADTLINVVFGGTAQTAPTPVPPLPTPPPVIGGDVMLEINAPADNSVLPFSLPIVNGRVFGLTEGDIVVRALDNEGNVLTEMTTALNAPTTTGAPATWQVSLDLEVAPATYGIIYAYLPTPFDGNLVADAVSVAYGQATTGQYITISDPLPYAIEPLDTPLIVSGRAGRLFEGALVVRALDDEGNVLAEAPTIVDAPDAGTGGEGDWQVSLAVNVTAGTRGWLYAFSTSANDGSVVASARVPVIFGDPTTRANFVQITTPLPDTRILSGNALLIAGRVDLNSSQQVTVVVTDALGNVLIEEPRAVTPLPELGYGTWEIILELRNLDDGIPVLVNAFTTSPFDSSILASDTIGLVFSEGGAPAETQVPDSSGGARG